MHIETGRETKLISSWKRSEESFSEKNTMLLIFEVAERKY